MQKKQHVKTSVSKDESREEDIRLLRDIKRGDTDAFGQIFERHRSSALKMANYLLRNKEDAKEVVQEVFIYLFRSPDIFMPKESGYSVSQVIFKNIRHRSLSLLEKLKRRVRAVSLTDDNGKKAVCKKPNQLDQIIEHANTEALRSNMQKLSLQQSTVLQLRHIEGLSFKEIGRQLSITPNTARSHASIGLKNLKASMRKSVI